jgi:hypothetical protein
MKTIIRLTESDLTDIVKRVIKEQWWLEFIEAGASEGPGMGWGPDIDLGSSGSGGDSESLKKVNVELGKVENLLNLANTKKNKINSRCSIYTNIKKPNANAGEIQDFLIAIGHNITKDWTFGDGTATAIGTYFYGGSAGINSVYKLWNKLKQEGLDVGTTSGYGVKMGTALSTKITKIINQKQSGCKTDLDKVNGILNNLYGIRNRLWDLQSKYSPKSGLRS